MLSGMHSKQIHKKYKSFTEDAQMRFSNYKCFKPAKKSENFLKLLGGVVKFLLNLLNNNAAKF